MLADADVSRYVRFVVGSGTTALADDFQKAGLHSANEQAAGFGNYKRKTSLTLRRQGRMAQHFFQKIASCAAFVMLAPGGNTAELPEKMESRLAVQKSR